MKNYVKVKVKHTIVDDANGAEKRVSDEFIFDAMSCPEGMLRAVRHFDDTCLKDWNILSLGQSNIKETVITGLTGIFYRVTVKYVEESDTGKEISTSSITLVEAGSTMEAEEMIHELNKDILMPYTVTGNNLSKVTEVVYADIDVRKFPLDEMFMKVLKTSSISYSQDSTGVFVDFAPLTTIEKQVVADYQKEFELV